MGDFLSKYLEYTKPLRGSVLYNKWVALSLVSATLERRCWLDRGRGQSYLYPNTYVILNGQAAKGKTFSAQTGMNILDDMNQRLPINEQLTYGPQKWSPAEFIEEFGRSKKLLRIGTKSWQYSSLFVYSGELQTSIKDIGGGNPVDDMLEWYDCPARYKKALRSGHIILKNVSLTFLSCTTPTFLSDFIASGNAGNGFTSRVIIVTERGLVEKALPLPPEDFKLRNELITRLQRIRKLKGTFKPTRSANDMIFDWARDVDNKAQTQEASSLMQDFRARMAIHGMKCSMLLSAGERDDLHITTDHVEKAIQMVEELEPTMKYVIGLRDVSRDKDRQFRLLELMPEGIWLDESAILQTCYTHGFVFTGGFQLDHMLDGMVRARILEKRQQNGGYIYRRRKQ